MTWDLKSNHWGRRWSGNATCEILFKDEELNFHTSLFFSQIVLNIIKRVIFQCICGLSGFRFNTRVQLAPCICIYISAGKRCVVLGGYDLKKRLLVPHLYVLSCYHTHHDDNASLFEYRPQLSSPLIDLLHPNRFIFCLLNPSTMWVLIAVSSLPLFSFVWLWLHAQFWSQTIFNFLSFRVFSSAQFILSMHVWYRHIYHFFNSVTIYCWSKYWLLWRVNRLVL